MILKINYSTVLSSMWSLSRNWSSDENAGVLNAADMLAVPSWSCKELHVAILHGFRNGESALI